MSRVSKDTPVCNALQEAPAHAPPQQCDSRGLQVQQQVVQDWRSQHITGVWYRHGHHAHASLVAPFDAV